MAALRNPSSNCSSGSDSESDGDQDWSDWVQEEEGDSNLQGDGLKISPTASHPSQGGPRLPTLALFPDKHGQKVTFGSPLEAIKDAEEKFGVDLLGVVQRTALDPLQVIRLLNHLRRPNTTLTPESLQNLKGNENFLNDDEELKPVEGAENDGLLQIDFDEMISNQLSQEEGLNERDPSPISSKEFLQNRKKMAELESELKATRLAFDELRRKYAESLGINKADLQDASSVKNPSTSSISTNSSSTPTVSDEKGLPEPKRDDDTHYFDSYSSNDIHQVMISDSIRTLSYAKFILSPLNSRLFKDKVIMDVGCGSGILSMFCARAGAKKVLAIDASKVAEKARENFKENKLNGIISIFNGKIEELDHELEPWKGKVDLIVSEWMGYFLLYESMLPSVLYARDRYLNPRTGVLAPSHCRMNLALLSDEEFFKEKIQFWKDVYGFKMNYMIKGAFDEAYTEVVKEENLVSNTDVILDLPLQTMDSKQPQFVSKFRFQVKKNSKSESKREDDLIEIHAFISWFDTWFYPSPPDYSNGDEKDVKHPIPAKGRKNLKGGEILTGLKECETRIIQESDVNGLHLKEDMVLSPSSYERTVDAKESENEGEKEGEIVSFTTGPKGKATHWKQTLFLLKEPILAKEGSIISGEIHVNESDSNSRELDVEIHYSTCPSESETEIDEKGKGKKVTAQLVQLFKVR